MNSKTTSVSVADFEIDMEKKESHEDAFSNQSDFEDLEMSDAQYHNDTTVSNWVIFLFYNTNPYLGLESPNNTLQK